jgi:hypothetical protein
MKMAIIFLSVCIFIPIDKIYCKGKEHCTINFHCGGNLSFSRQNKITKPHVYASPNIFPTIGIGIFKKINLRSALAVDYLYLSYGSNIKFDMDINQRGKNTLSSSALNHEISILYYYLISKKYFNLFIGTGIDYYNSQNRGIGSQWHLGNTKLGIYETGDYTLSQHSIGVLPSMRISKTINKISLSFTIYGRKGSKKLLTSTYTLYDNYIPEEQFVNNFGDMIITTISIGYRM